jgi:hypothetical protein
VKEVYILATQSDEPLELEELREPFESEDLRFEPGGEGWSFDLYSTEAHVRVRFESLKAALGLTPEILSGSPQARELLSQAHGFYRFDVEHSTTQPSVAVFEALWAARALMERVPGVLLDITAFKLHEPQDVAEITELEFDIRDHVNLHAVQATQTDSPLWVHSHGMEKFGARNVEMFGLAEADLAPAESFLHELCTDLAFGQGPQVRAEVETSAGQSFMVLPSEEARGSLLGLIPLETFEGHESNFLTVVSPEGRHTVSDLLRPYRERFEKEAPERSEALKAQAEALLPAFRVRFQRKGFMEPTTFLVRAPFETHPEGKSVSENLWLEVLSWEDDTIVGKLVDGAAQTTEWRKGAAVEISEEQINSLAVGRAGKPLDEDEMKHFLLAERPS